MKTFIKKLDIFKIILFLALLIYTITLIVPFSWTVMTSFKTRLEFIGNKFGLPEEFSFSNYLRVFLAFKVPARKEYANFIELFTNGVLYSVLCSTASTIVCTMTAYVVAKYNCIFCRVLYSVIVVVMILPIVGSTPSTLQLMRDLNLHNTFLGVTLKNASFISTYFLILYAAFKGISWEYAEAGFIDGASHWFIFIKVMVPLVLPTMLSIGLLNFITFWNDWQTSLLFLPDHPTIAYGLYRFQTVTDPEVGGTPMLMCACVLVMIPIFVLFIIFKDKLLGSMTVGGIKG